VQDSSDPLKAYRPLARLFSAKDIALVRSSMLAHGGDPNPVVRSLRRGRWKIGIVYVVELTMDLHRAHRRCGEALAHAGWWGWYYRRCLLLLYAYRGLARLVWAGLRFRFGFGTVDCATVQASIVQLLGAQRLLAFLE
jgi:hypothetical protein